MYSVPPAIRSTSNEDGGIVLDIDHGQMFRLNPVGVLILKMIAGGREETDITKEIAKKYGTDEETVAADVREFLKSLEEHKLVNAQLQQKAL